MAKFEENNRGTPKQKNRKRKFTEVDLNVPKVKKSKAQVTPAVVTPDIDHAGKKKKKKTVQKEEVPKQSFEITKNTKSKFKKNKKTLDKNELPEEITKTAQKDIELPSKKKQLKANKNDNAQSLPTKEKTEVINSQDVARKECLDNRTLFVKNLPMDITVKHMKALSNDIKHVRMRTKLTKYHKKRQNILFAYLEFENEKIAEKNFKVLDQSYLKGNKLVVDYVGSKSNYIKNKHKKAEQEERDPSRLFITGLPSDATVNDVRKIFPKAKEIVIPKRKKDEKAFGYGFISFDSPTLAQQAHSSSQDLKLGNSQLVVLFAKKLSEGSNKDSNKAKKDKKRQSKKKDKSVTSKKKGNKGDDEEADEEKEKSNEESVKLAKNINEENDEDEDMEEDDDDDDNEENDDDEEDDDDE